MTTSPDRRTAQERGIKMGNRVIEPAGPRISQLITATIHLTGSQELRIDTHGSHQDRGGHISVASDSLLIYLHDQKSAGAYARAWIDAWYIASHLPEQVEIDGRQDSGPVMMVRAYGTENVEHVHDPARGVAMVRIGRLTWLLHDRAAWASTTDTWREVAELTPVVLAPRSNDPLPRRIGHRRRPITTPTPATPPPRSTGLDL